MRKMKNWYGESMTEQEPVFFLHLIIILTDLYGGTPSNVAAIYAPRKNYTVISGVNFPILIEAEMSRTPEECEDSQSCGTMAERLISAGTAGISDIRKIMEEMRKK